MSLLDAPGRPVHAQVPAATDLTLDTRPYRAGVYLLRIDYASGSVTRRVVLQ